MKFDNKLFDNLILHACGITIVDYNNNADIEIDEDFPILMPLADGTFASGYEDRNGVAYFYFPEGHVPEDILIREA